MKKLLLLIFFATIWACTPQDEVYFGEQEVEGYKPIYVPEDEAHAIEISEPLPIENAGKLYIYGNLLLINEIGKGIHVIDNTSPAKPIRLNFIRIPGCNDMVIKGNILYANNYSDLLAIKIIDENSVEITERIKDVVTSNSLFPVERDYYFECVDPTKGVVVGWQQSMLKNPECYR